MKIRTLYCAVWLCFAVYFLSLYVATAQNQPQIATKVDTKSIKIGEQIEYQISVESKENEVVTFPEGQTFSPLEMVFSSSVDTFRQQEKQRLVKNYYLTHFDSGVYTIPQQRIGVGNAFFTTDSLQIQVHNVVVDTLKQPLFDIKPIISVQKPTSNKVWIGLAGLLLLIVLLVVGYVCFFRKKKLSEAEKIALLPAFDRAILGLKNLQNSKYLLESKHKEYYSELTDIVRKYLEEEVHISASESTTDELITKLELLLDSERLHLSKETIGDFRRVLQKADLVKFAKSQPQDYEAENDRQTIENVVVKTKEALPEPSEEDKLKDENYRKSIEKLIHRRRKKAAIITSIYVVFYGILGFGGWWWYKQNFVSGSTQELLNKKDWVTSVYGFPPVKITTPMVLERRESDLLPSRKGFISGNALEEDFTIGIVSQSSSLGKEHLTSETVGMIVKAIEAQTEIQFKGQNILTKHESYTTPQGAEALKIFGSFDREVSKGKYVKMGYQNYVFANGKNFCWIVFFYQKSQEETSEKIIDRVMSSVEFVE